ncbi:MAG TPA: CHAT domain-containing protein [Pyrinomonadaceae bacterium]|jgi:CHAT domain-containing protein/tetratricopeptide (TPR) repeat protein
MSHTFRVASCLLALSLSLNSSARAQSPSSPNPPAPSEAGELASALARATSEEERERLLARGDDSTNGALLAALKELAHPLVQKGDYPEALRISKLAVRVAERGGDRARLGSALCDLGAIYGRRNPPTEASDYLQKCLAIFEEVGDKRGKARALQALGVTYDTQRRFELAVESYEKSLALSVEAGDRNLTALVLNSLGLAHSSLGHYELGLEFYQKSSALSEELNDRGTLNMALNNIATYHTARGRYGEALDYLHRSLRILEEMGDAGDRRSLAYKLQNIGLVYRRQGSYEQALAYARRSLAILEELDDKFGVANLQNNIGVIYKSQGLYEQAQEWFRKSLQRYEALQHKGGIARSLNNIGDAYRLRGRYELAEEHLLKGLRLREEGRDRGAVALSLNNLGRLYQEQGRHAEMLEVSRRAAGLSEGLNDAEELWKAQERTGRALRAQGQPAEARQSFLASINTVEALRREAAGGEQQQQSFLENRLSPWLGMVELLVSRQEYAEALSFAEASKARVLLDALQAGRADLRQTLSQQERKDEEERRLRLVSLNSQLTDEARRDKPDAARVAALRAEVEKARLEYEDFETRLYAAHPELRIQRGEAPLITSEEITALLPDSASALLEYVVDDDATYLFAVTKSPGKSQADVRVYTLPFKREELARQTEAFRLQLAGRDLGFRASASRLYELLLKPAEAQLRGKTSLVIVPDNTLWDLPFQALLNGSNRFLLEDAGVAYAPSLTVLREMTRRRKGRGADAAPATLLALGNPLLGKGTNYAPTALRDGKLDSLPEAEQEVRALGRLYGAARSKVYTGAEAREDRFKSEAGKARILHFAAHGLVNNASPMYSHLALAGGGAGEDGLLEAWELTRLDLRADLAVLSACETARGRTAAGEGMIGLSWAMFVAGVPSIVVSQWKVESAGTRELMVSFHRALLSPQAAGKAKTTKSEALRQSALKLLKNPETNHPFYWAGFVLIGEGN